MSTPRRHRPDPPIARRVEQVREHHGDRFIDPYEWLRDVDDPAVLAHLDAENAYTATRLAHLEPLTEAVYEELRGRIRETDLSVPVRIGQWWYYARTLQGAQYEVHCRSPYDAAAPRPRPQPAVPLPGEQVLLDGNREALGQEFFELGDLEVTVDGSTLGVLYDVHGEESYDLQIRDIATGRVLDDAVRGASVGLIWSVCGSYLFYTRRDEAWRTHQVWRHRVGAAARDDVLVYQEDDEQFSVALDGSRDERWLIIHSESRSTTEVWLLDLRRPTAPARVVQPRTTGLEYDVDVDGERIILVHNASRPDFDVAWAMIERPEQEHWRPLLSGGDGERVLGVDAFASCLAVSLRRAGLPTVLLLPREGDSWGAPYPLPAPVDSDLATVSLGANPTYDTASLQVLVESYLVPRAVYDYDLSSGLATLLKQREVPGYQPERYAEQRIWATAPDGVRIPISLIHLRTVRADGTNPGHIYGYGAYEVSMDPFFSALRLSLLDRGVVCAVAHVRGGGELGRGWYDAGRLEHKTTSFTDFVAASRALVDEGWVAPDRLAAEGGSAGGLLVGTALNLAPELYRAVHAAVPFVDTLTTMLDPSLPLVVGEWEEWGDPLHDARAYARLKAYSPYENIRPVRYPTVLATTSLHDTRVLCVEPAKWVQALRATVDDDADRPVLLHTEMAAGHGGQSGRYDAWRQSAFEVAFVLDAIGAREPDR